jgi:hypothetical protein
MRKLGLLVCLCVLATLLVGVARAADPGVGSLSVEGGKGRFLLEVRGAVVLGRLANGSVTVVDRSPSDAHVATVSGRRVVVQRRLPNRVFVRGQGLRFRMLGGSFRIVLQGSGVSLSVVGRGVVTLDGEPRAPGDDVGIYSLDGTDCSIESQVCEPIPTEPTRVKLEPVITETPRSGPGSR